MYLQYLKLLFPEQVIEKTGRNPVMQILEPDEEGEKASIKLYVPHLGCSLKLL